MVLKPMASGYSSTLKKTAMRGWRWSTNNQEGGAGWPRARVPASPLAARPSKTVSMRCLRHACIAAQKQRPRGRSSSQWSVGPVFRVRDESGMDFFIQMVVSGMSVGAVYAMIGLGLNLTFWTTRVLNFGQGSVLMAGAMLTAVMVASGVNVFLAVGVSLLATGFILWLVELVGVRPMMRMP